MVLQWGSLNLLVTLISTTMLLLLDNQIISYFAASLTQNCMHLFIGNVAQPTLDCVLYSDVLLTLFVRKTRLLFTQYIIYCMCIWAGHTNSLTKIDCFFNISLQFDYACNAYYICTYAKLAINIFYYQWSNLYNFFLIVNFLLLSDFV